MRVRHDMVCCYVVRPSRGAGGTSYEFLQLRRAEAYLRGTWQTVYGGAHDDEPLWRAAQRELLEETALVPEDLFRLPTVRSFYTDVDDTVWHVTGFCAIVPDRAVVRFNQENDDARWIPVERAVDAFMWATDKEAIAEIVRDILNDSPAKAHLRIAVSDEP